MKIDFQKASTEKQPEIMNLIKFAITNMGKAGIFQWDEFYPTEEVVTNDINNGEQYIGKVGDKIAVIYVINTSCDKEYYDGDWQYPNANYRIIHRLCVHPDFQNKGIAKTTMQHIETELRQLGIDTIRLDAFTENPYALSLYENLGYKIVGYADWRKGRFYLMEKCIDEPKINYQIRQMKTDEYHLLEDFLYQAIYQPDKTNLAPRSIINKPELQVYIEDFGKKKDDYCFCAEVDNKIVGAVWVRNINGYGSIDDVTVEFAISVFDDYQNMGIGTALINKMIEHLKELNYPKASLAVQKENYALRMYQNVGFEIVDENEQEYIMIHKLAE